MSLDIFLTVVTLAVAIIGTLLKDPPPRVKALLIALAIVASIVSVAKTAKDESERKFMRAALTTTLTPSNASYNKLIDDLENNSGFDEADCHHQQDGMACFLSSAKDVNKKSVVVLNKTEVAEIYANEIGHASNKDKIKSVLAQSYDPSVLDDELSDKVGLVGTAVWFNLAGDQADYAYGNFGVKIVTNKNNMRKDILMSPQELAAFQERNAADLFGAIAHRFEAKFKEEAADLLIPQPIQPEPTAKH